MCQALPLASEEGLQKRALWRKMTVQVSACLFSAQWIPLGPVRQGV